MASPRRTAEGRIILVNPDGSIATEETITVPHPSQRHVGKTATQWINIPTMYGGKRVSEQEAEQIIAQSGGVDPDTRRQLQVYPTAEEAVRAAVHRSALLGRLYGSQGDRPVSELTDDPQYQAAIAQAQAGLQQRQPGMVSPDAMDEVYDSLKAMMLEQSLAEAQPKKAEKQGWDFRHFIPGYTQGYIKRQQLEQRQEAIKLEQQAMKGQQATRLLQMQKMLAEIQTKRQERQRQQQVGNALRVLAEGNLDPQAKAELQGQVQQGLIGMGDVKEALAYGQPASQVKTPFQAMLAAEGGDVERALQRHERSQSQVRTPFQAILEAEGGNVERAVKRYGQQKAAEARQTFEATLPGRVEISRQQGAVAADRAAAMETARRQAEQEFRESMTLLDVEKDDSRNYVDTQTGEPLAQTTNFSAAKQAIKTRQAVRLKDDEAKQLGGIRSMIPLLRTMQQQLAAVYGPGGIFERLTPQERAMAATRGGMARLTQSNPALVEAERTLKANVDLLRRNLQGQVGTQTEQDAQRGLKALPKLDGIPDSAEVAYGTLDTLTETVNRMAGTLLGNPRFRFQGLQPLQSEAGGEPRVLTRQQIQALFTDDYKQLGWTLEQFIQWYREKGYQVE